MLICFIIQQSESKTRVRYWKMVCKTSNKTVLNNISCQIKTYKRENYITIRATIIRKVLMSARVTAITYRKNSDGYQPILTLKDLEICKIIKHIEESPFPFVKDFIQYVKSVAKGNYMDACGMIGDVSLNNASFSKVPGLDLYPEGKLNRI